jgi:hypothetical protein
MITVQPPEISIMGCKFKLRPMTELFKSLLARHIKSDDPAEAGELFITGYVLAASAETSQEAAKRITAPTLKEDCAYIALELSDADSTAVIKYLESVFNATEEAQVSVAESPGK